MAMAAATLRGMEVWPPQSPDLNPSEQVRDILGDKVQDKKSRIFKSWRKCYRRSGKKLVFWISESHQYHASESVGTSPTRKEQ